MKEFMEYFRSDKLDVNIHFSYSDTETARKYNKMMFHYIARAYLEKRIKDEPTDESRPIDIADLLCQQGEMMLLNSSAGYKEWVVRIPDDFYYCHDEVCFNDEVWPLSALKILQAAKESSISEPYAYAFREVPNKGWERRIHHDSRN